PLVQDDRLVPQQRVVREIGADAGEGENALADREDDPHRGSALLELTGTERHEIQHQALGSSSACLTGKLLELPPLLLRFRSGPVALFRLLLALGAPAALLTNRLELRGVLLSH